ncbi:hypothetical protein BM127P2_00008 [Phocaeicola phage BM127P2]|nr:hypothetical protein BM127P1_00041 [Phocaeicola phage BM127P1]WAX08287.1 hypothetical protein BM127P2_00008 [Phocaeicola phage BM127P2]WAX08360.1 hypothetical protein BM127P3_00034 [Phocaeicola phage BM127P3]WAX08381.1 hypothetical protein BM127P4_00008 [Phocaeicola phage BM127P4]
MKGFGVRSFMINGLTAKWGIGENRVPPIWDINLIGYWDARSFPDGALASIPNKATLATKAPDLTVTGATMAGGTLQFDGVNDSAVTDSFMFPDRFTVFWDLDWLEGTDEAAGVKHYPSFQMVNHSSYNSLFTYLKTTSGGTPIPNTSVGISTDGRVYAHDGAVTQFKGEVGDKRGEGALVIAQNGTKYAQLGFRQLLIFNKELTQAEVNNVLTTMFTP